MYSKDKKNDLPTLQYNYIPKQDSLILGYYDLFQFPNISSDITLSVFGNPSIICSDPDYIFKSGKLYIVFEIGENEYKLGGNDAYTASIDELKVTAKQSPPNLEMDLTFTNLSLLISGSDKKPKVVIEKDISDLLVGTDKYTVFEIKSITNFNIYPLNNINLINNIKLEMYIDTKYSFHPLNCCFPLKTDQFVSPKLTTQKY
jgi:hypothetical protein